MSIYLLKIMNVRNGTYIQVCIATEPWWRLVRDQLDWAAGHEEPTMWGVYDPQAGKLEVLGSTLLNYTRNYVTRVVPRVFSL